MGKRNYDKMLHKVDISADLRVARAQDTDIDEIADALEIVALLVEMRLHGCKLEPGAVADWAVSTANSADLTIGLGKSILEALKDAKENGGKNE